MELSRSNQVQIGIAVLILGAAGYILFQGTKPLPDGTISAWAEPLRMGKNPNIPIGPKNPADPSMTAATMVLACFDGRFEITEYPAAQDRRATIIFEPDRRHEANSSYQGTTERIAGIRDSCTRLLTYAGYSAAEGHPLGLLNSAGMTTDQRKAEMAARQTMMDSITLIDNAGKLGTGDQHAYDDVMGAMKNYRKTEGDPSKDAAKATAARAVIEACKKYFAAQELVKMKPIDVYVTSVSAMLTSDQRAKLATLGDKIKVRDWVNRPARVAKAK